MEHETGACSPEGRSRPRRVSVGLAGFEPATPCSQSRCAAKLRYSPWSDIVAPSTEFRRTDCG